VDSSDSSLPQRTSPLDLNESLFCRGLGPGGLCHKEMMVVDWSYEMGAGAQPLQVKLAYPLELLSQYEEVVVT
jgi:hypothetical protein